MADVTINAVPNGPYLVKGPVTLIDSTGERVECKKDVVALCRCGASTTKPFCDASHKRVGFIAEETSPRVS